MGVVDVVDVTHPVDAPHTPGHTYEVKTQV